MAVRVGSNGEVIAFEPHPEIFSELQRNTTAWPKSKLGKLRLENVALGESSGMAILTLPDEHPVTLSLKAATSTLLSSL
jgi:FkbM family methyltransferase